MPKKKRSLSIKRYLPVVGIIWLVALMCFIWGSAMGKYHVFPHDIIQPIMKETVDFFKGHKADKRSLWKRFKSSVTHNPFAFSLAPKTFPLKLQFKKIDSSSYAGPTAKFIENSIYFSDGSHKDYYLIFGSFAFEDSNWGVILISPEGKVLRTWSIKPQEFEYLGAHIGLALSSNGDIATNTNGVLTSYNWCGEKKWEAPWKKQEERQYHDSVLGYDYHHDITYYEGKFYTFLGPEIVSVDEMTGNIEERIHVLDIIKSARDQNLSLFDARFINWFTADELNKSTLAELTVGDPFHLNKVDVLSYDLSNSFYIFEEGDMLVSMRELNLIFVFRPKTMKVLWYRYGLTTRQHDATFQRGYISVFDNNPFSNLGNNPQIVSLGVSNHSRSVLFDLRRWGAKMRGRGNFEFDDNSRILMFTDDDNGRAVVGKLTGEPIFVFENSVEPGKNLTLRNITKVSPEQYRKWSLKCEQ